MTVTVAVDRGVATILIDNPPANALGADVRAGLAAAFDDIERDKRIKAAVVTGVGKTFSGGADIREFGRPPLAPFLPDLLERIEGCRVPTLAAINGAAMGGGLELALACRFRIASPAASLGLPEVKLGLIPGAGGTQRLPRLIGMTRAAEMIVSGKPVAADEALAIRLVDAVVEGDLAAQAREFIRMRLGVARVPLSEVAVADFDSAWLDAFAENTKRRARGQMSPLKAIEAVRAAGTLPFAQGLAKERAVFVECMASEQRKGLIHAFFAERAVGKIPEIESAEPRRVETIAVIGAGTMGCGIAIACAEAGYRTPLFDASSSALDKAFVKILAHLDASVKKGRLDAKKAAEARGRIARLPTLDGAGDADLVVEAVVERMEVKRDVFAGLAAIAKPGAILATNTSYLDVAEIATATRRPSDVLGMHFFSPANVMRLLEIIRTKTASKSALATAFAVGKRLGKVCILAENVDGFIGNRIFKAYRKAADHLVEDGALPWEVDDAIRDFGFAMGPFETSDLAGLDIGYLNRRREDAARDPNERYVAIPDRLYEKGRLGQKTGAGWYKYDESRRAEPDPEVEKIILAASAEKGIARRRFSGDEIRDRLLAALVNEAANVLDAGVARSAADIDMAYIHGYGFPPYRGGPMFYADAIGAAAVLARIERYAEEDGYFWRPARLLRRLAAEGTTFAEFRRDRLIRSA
jgi:3-hydroxyacyl-CoA dehydrogenase